MQKRNIPYLINIGTGKDFTIKYYATLFSKIILKNKNIKINYDKSKPNGTPRKVMDISLAKKYGWSAKNDLNLDILNTYKSFLKELKK